MSPIGTYLKCLIDSLSRLTISRCYLNLLTNYSPRPLLLQSDLFSTPIGQAYLFLVPAAADSDLVSRLINRSGNGRAQIGTCSMKYGHLFGMDVV